MSFNATTSTDSENGALTYAWNFGDGFTGTGPLVNHTFTATPGVPTSYTVTLTVTDVRRLTSQATLLVSVNNTPPQAEISKLPERASVSAWRGYHLRARRERDRPGAFTGADQLPVANLPAPQ